MDRPAVLTLTGDNALTVGVMLALLYLGALLLVQIGMRVVKMPMTGSKSTAPSPPQDPGNQAPINAGQGAGY